MIARLILSGIMILQFALITRAVASWLPQPKSELGLKVCHIAYKLTEPLLKIARSKTKNIPIEVGGKKITFDTSYLAVFLCLALAQLFVPIFLPF